MLIMAYHCEKHHHHYRLETFLAIPSIRVALRSFFRASRFFSLSWLWLFVVCPSHLRWSRWNIKCWCASKNVTLQKMSTFCIWDTKNEHFFTRSIGAHVSHENEHPGASKWFFLACESQKWALFACESRKMNNFSRRSVRDPFGSRKWTPW